MSARRDVRYSMLYSRALQIARDTDHADATMIFGIYFVEFRNAVDRVIELYNIEVTSILENG